MPNPQNNTDSNKGGGGGELVSLKLHFHRRKTSSKQTRKHGSETCGQEKEPMSVRISVSISVSISISISSASHQHIRLDVSFRLLPCY